MIEFCVMNNLKITNTFFKYKPIHLTTRQSPVPYVNITACKTNTPRRNPFRNQIDYVLVRNSTNAKVFDSKATISTTTNSNHKQKPWSNGNINQKLKAPTNVSTYIIWKTKTSETVTKMRSNLCNRQSWSTF